MLLVTLGIAVIIENTLLYVFRADTRTIDVPYAFQTIDIGSTFWLSRAWSALLPHLRSHSRSGSL